MSREDELLERIRILEEQNNLLQDKLDMIYAILSPEYENENDENAEDESEDDSPSALVQITQ